MSHPQILPSGLKPIAGVEALLRLFGTPGFVIGPRGADLQKCHHIVSVAVILEGEGKDGKEVLVVFREHIVGELIVAERLLLLLLDV